MTGTFQPFGPDHLAVLVGLALGTAWLVWRVPRRRGHEDRRLRRGLALALLANELSAGVLAWRQGHFVPPLQLCDFALLLAVVVLWRPHPKVGALAFFWGAAGGLQALLTPDLHAPVFSYWWWQFFGSHVGTVLAVVYLAAAGHLAPSGRDIWWVWGMTNVYAALVGVVNWLTGANFGYLARKPAHPSLLDAFGPWPWYIIGMEVVALGSFAVLSVPFALARRRTS